MSMFNDIALSLENYDALLQGWSSQNLQLNVPFSGGDSQYSSSSQTARNILTGYYYWRVADGGERKP